MVSVVTNHLPADLASGKDVLGGGLLAILDSQRKEGLGRLCEAGPTMVLQLGVKGRDELER